MTDVHDAHLFEDLLHISSVLIRVDMLDCNAQILPLRYEMLKSCVALVLRPII